MGVDVWKVAKWVVSVLNPPPRGSELLELKGLELLYHRVWVVPRLLRGGPC